MKVLLAIAGGANCDHPPRCQLTLLTLIVHWLLNLEDFASFVQSSVHIECDKVTAN